EDEEEEEEDEAHGDERVTDSFTFDSEDEDELEEEELEIIKTAEATAEASQRVAAVSRSIVRDKSAARKGQRDEVVKTIRSMTHCRVGTRTVDTRQMDMYNELEIKDKEVKAIVRSFAERQITVIGQVLLGWHNPETNRILIIDGRHRLAAIKQMQEKSLEDARKRGEKNPQWPVVKMMVDIVQGSRVSAVIKSMHRSSLKVKVTTFEKVVRLRTVLKKLNLIDNKTITLDMKSKLIKRHVSEGYAKYHVNGACLPEGEFAYFKAHAQEPLVDKTATLTGYLTARQVNGTKAMDLLKELAESTDKEQADATSKMLEEMQYSIKDFLEWNKYAAEDAAEVESSVVKSPISYACIRRLMTGNNRLANGRHGASVSAILEACERCLPPITFINPRMTAKSRLIETECTLYIFDND
ncbi:hypothetical protein PFISCL1PPCAC_24880, partial [Pristionchus fissidentatus]